MVFPKGSGDFFVRALSFGNGRTRIPHAWSSHSISPTESCASSHPTNPDNEHSQTLDFPKVYTLLDVSTWIRKAYSYFPMKRG